MRQLQVAQRSEIRENRTRGTDPGQIVIDLRAAAGGPVNLLSLIIMLEDRLGNATRRCDFDDVLDYAPPTRMPALAPGVRPWGRPGVARQARRVPACDGKSDQSWHWGSENGFTGYYELVNGGGDCLGLSGGGTIAGTPVISGQCVGHADQHWRTAAECVRMTSHGNVDYWPLFSYAASSKGLYVIGSLAGTTTEGADMLLEGYIASCDFQFWDGLPDPLI